MSDSHVTIQAPASKSVSHRALIAAALSNGVSRVRNALESVDLKITRQCLEAGGVEFTPDKGDWLVRGKPGGPRGGPLNNGPVQLYMHESGTSCRLLTAVAAAGHGLFEVRGAPRMHERPIGSLAEALARLGVEIDWLGDPGCPPLRLATQGLSGGRTRISLDESSQYLSGLLMAAPLARGATVIEVAGEKVVSWPYVALTLQVMEDFGLDFSVQVKSGSGFAPVEWRTIDRVEPGKVRFVVQPSWYVPREYEVEGDWSNASYFLAAGALFRPVTVVGLRRESVQGDRAILDILEQMGAKIEWTGGVVTVSPGELKGVTVDMGRCPDLVPTVAVAAAFAKGPTTIENVAHLRIKETDRLAALENEIAKTGAKTSTTADTLTVTPAPLPAGERIEFRTYGDHRIAMSMSLFGPAGVEVVLDDPGCTTKSFPDFFERFERVRRGA